jgi:hypothetical protein
MSFFSSTNTNNTHSQSSGSDQPLPPAPDSLLSNQLPQSLISATNTTQSAMPHPRTPWTVKDHSLKHIPKYYPPMDPNTTGFVPGTTASVVAFRIADCLRQHSVAVEYDNESITANAMTVDRCHFEIQLWKGKVTPTVDYSHGVVVECIRRSGNTMSFHQVCSAILQAARGESSGADVRKPHQTNAMEYPRMPSSVARPPTLARKPSSPVSFTTFVVSPRDTLERVQELLKKDRLECQQLAMERLIQLTTPSVCGYSHAVATSKILLTESWLYPYIVAEQDSTEASEPEETKPITFALPKPTLKRSLSPRLTNDNFCQNEMQHETHLRAFALRVLFNALTNVVDPQNQDTQFLSKLLQTPNCPLLEPKLLETLADDLQGANRPPSVVEASCQLASIHEAALAVGCLRILAENAPGIKEFWNSEHMLERLQVARSCGRSTHAFLQAQTDLVHYSLTEDARSC